MQNAKDSFYMALRGRLAALNPDRTVILRGVVRPGILTEEAEAPFAQTPDNVFLLRWLGLGVEVDLASNLVAMECEIIYGTCGSQSFGGLDRGRAMTEMDDELARILQPGQTPKMCYIPKPAVPLLTNVFWDEPVIAPLMTQRDRLSRGVRVMVYSYEEPGE